MGMRPPPTTSENHLYGSGFHGSPVEPRMRKLERSWDLTGSSPAGINARTSVGEMPRISIPCCSIIFQRRSGPGKLGAPSYMKTVAPAA